MKKLLLFLLIGTSVYSMEPKLAAPQKPSKKVRKEMLADFDSKRAMLAELPEAHQALTRNFTSVCAIALNKNQNNNFKFFEKMLVEEVFASSGGTKLETGAKPIKLFISDQAEYKRSRKHGFSSRTLLKRLCKDSSFVDLFKQLKTDSCTIQGYQKLLSLMTPHFQQNNIIIKHDDLNAETPYLSIIATNENNPTIHRPENYNTLKRLLIGVDVLSLCLCTLPFDRSATQEVLKKIIVKIDEEEKKFLALEKESSE